MMPQITTERESLNTNSVQSDCCPYCGTTDKLPQPRLIYRTRTEAQVELVASLATRLISDLQNEIMPRSGELNPHGISFALEDICSLNTALIGLHEILAAKLDAPE